MTKRTRIIEGTWNGTSCDTRDLPARQRSCPSCNNPREETGQESVACGTEEKCTRKKLGNGFARETCEDITKYRDESYQDRTEETRYRTVPVYALSCTYDTHEWKALEHRDASGRDDAPRWPSLTAGPTERLRREEKYGVRIRFEDDGPREHLLEPKTEREFLTWKKGQKVPLKVSNGGEVQVTASEAVR